MGDGIEVDLPVSGQALAIEGPVLRHASPFPEDRAGSGGKRGKDTHYRQGRRSRYPEGTRNRGIITLPKKVSRRVKMRNKEPIDRIPLAFFEQEHASQQGQAEKARQ